MHNTLLNSANISVVVTDQNGVIQFFNAGAERILGYIASDVINKTTVMDLCDFAEATSARAVNPEREGRAHLPDVIGMNVNLPDIISRYEALKILLQDPATKSIPVISLSANAMPSTIQRGIAAGFFRYIKTFKN